MENKKGREVKRRTGHITGNKEKTEGHREEREIVSRGKSMYVCMNECM